MKKQENKLAAKSLNLYDIEKMVPGKIKQAFFGHSYNEIKAAVMWYAANRNRYTKDADSAKLAEELDYIEMKDAFYKENRLEPNAECRIVLMRMCYLSGKSNPEIYYGLKGGKSKFSRIMSGQSPASRKALVNFSVNMNLAECYVKMLFEANEMKMSEKDLKSYRAGMKDPLDLGYLDVYEKKGAKEGVGR